MVINKLEKTVLQNKTKHAVQCTLYTPVFPTVLRSVSLLSLNCWRQLAEVCLYDLVAISRMTVDRHADPGLRGGGGADVHCHRSLPPPSTHWENSIEANTKQHWNPPPPGVPVAEPKKDQHIFGWSTLESTFCHLRSVSPSCHFWLCSALLQTVSLEPLTSLTAASNLASYDGRQPLLHLLQS